MPGAVVCREILAVPPELAAAAGDLYREAGFIAPDDPDDFIAPAWLGSTLVVGAFEDDRLVGMARAISDGVSDCYIQDVAVTKSCRGRGIGRELVAVLMTGLRGRGIDWIALVGVPGSEEFYRKLGFTARPGHTLWLAGND